MSDTFHSILRKQFGSRVPFAPEFIEVPAAIEPAITEFFASLVRLDPAGALRVQRIWIDGGQLRIAVDGCAHGLDDIILQAEEAANHV